ncbi:MAG: retropepsin-like aspartic protease [Planctomycetota bacterium]
MTHAIRCSERPAPPARLNPCTLALLLCAAVALASQVGCGSTAASKPRATITLAAESPVQTSRLGGFYLTTATMTGGRPVTLLIDTGAQTSVLDRASAERLLPGGIEKSRTRVIGANGVTVASQGEATIERLDVGGLTAQDLRVAVLDLSPISRILGVHLDGLLGWDVLKNTVTSFDDPSGTVSIARSVPARLRATPGDRIEDNGIPVGRVTLPGGRRVPVVIDTGSDGWISFASLDPLPLIGEPRAAGVARAIGGTAAVEAATLDGAIMFGGASIQDPIVETTPGLPRVGAGIFRGRTLTLDGPGRRFWLSTPG